MTRIEDTRRRAPFILYKPILMTPVWSQVMTVHVKYVTQPATMQLMAEVTRFHNESLRSLAKGMGCDLVLVGT